MELEIFGKDGKSTGKKAKLSDAVFGIEPNDHAIWLDVKQHLANRRQGTSKTLEKSEVSGSTKKLHRQKGTGGSRKGSIKSPLFKGGARVFGPRPRDYHFKLNKKVKDLARRSALTYKAKDGTLKVIDALSLTAPKTSEFASFLKAFDLTTRKSLVVVPSKALPSYTLTVTLPSRLLASAMPDRANLLAVMALSAKLVMVGVVMVLS